MGAVSARISVPGAIPGAAFGAGSGAAIGGVSGGLNSILNDDVSFGQGAGIGALSGGILGAIAGGISGYINNSKATGAETYNLIGRGSKSLESNIPYSAEYAKRTFKMLMMIFQVIFWTLKQRKYLLYF